MIDTLCYQKGLSPESLNLWKQVKVQEKIWLWSIFQYNWADIDLPKKKKKAAKCKYQKKRIHDNTCKTRIILKH